MDKLVLQLEERQLAVHSFIGEFERGIAALKESGLELITASEIAMARVAGGRGGSLDFYGVLVGESVVYFPDGTILVTDRSHNYLLRKPAAAARAHRKEEELYLSGRAAKELCDKAEVDAEKAIGSGVLYLSRKNAKSGVFSCAFGEVALTRFLFGEMAEPYARFLEQQNKRHAIVQVASPRHVQKHGHPFVRAMRIEGSYHGYGFNCDSEVGDLCHVNGARIELAIPSGVMRALGRGRGFEYDGVKYEPVPAK